MAGTAVKLASQTYVRMNLNNRSHEPIWILAYDPICRVRVFEAVLVDEGSTTVKVCPDRRGRGSIIIYDRNGRALDFSGVLDGSDVDIRFR